MPATTDLPRLTRRIRRARRLTRLVRRVPSRWRRPEPVMRVALFGGCLWFAILFASLARTGDWSAPATVAFFLAATASAAGAICASTRRYQWSVLALGTMLTAGQLTALIQQF